MPGAKNSSVTSLKDLIRLIGAAQKALILGLIVTVGGKASAGHWNVTYSGGQGTVWTSGSYPYSLGFDGYGGGGSAAGGTITATFTWSFDEGTEGPPSAVYVVEQCTAEGISFNDNPVGADNGLGSPKTSSSVQVSPGYVQKRIYATGKRITRLNTGGTLQFVVTASPSASGLIMASVRYSASVTNYAVSVSSYLDTTYKKGASGPVSNLGEVLTPREGDTWVDPNSVRYFNIDSVIFSVYDVAIGFRRELIGPWVNPYHAWNVDPTAYTDDLLHEYEAVYGAWEITPTQLADMGKNGPLIKKIRLTVTDDGGNGLSETATYDMRIHNKYDNWRTVGTLPSIWEVVDNFTVNNNPPHASYPSGVPCSWTSQNVWWTAMQAAATQFAAVTSGAIANPIFSAGFGALGIGIDQLGPKPYSGISAWAWGLPGSTIDGNNWNVDPTQYRCSPSLEEKHDLYLQEADQWGPNGYVGIARDIKKKRNGAQRWIGHFFPAANGTA